MNITITIEGEPVGITIEFVEPKVTKSKASTP